MSSNMSAFPTPRQPTWLMSLYFALKIYSLPFQNTLIQYKSTHLVRSVDWSTTVISLICLVSGHERQGEREFTSNSETASAWHSIHFKDNIGTFFLMYLSYIPKLCEKTGTRTHWAVIWQRLHLHNSKLLTKRKSVVLALVLFRYRGYRMYIFVELEPTIFVRCQIMLPDRTMKQTWIKILPS